MSMGQLYGSHVANINGVLILDGHANVDLFPFAVNDFLPLSMSDIQNNVWHVLWAAWD